MTPPHKFGGVEYEVFEELFPAVSELSSTEDYVILLDMKAEHDWELPWPFSLIQDFAEHLWNELLSWIDSIARAVEHAASVIVSRVEAATKNLLYWLWNNMISPALAFLRENVIDRIVGLWESRIAPFLKESFEAVSGWLQSLWNNYILVGLRWLHEELGKALHYLIFDVVVANISNFVNGIFKPEMASTRQQIATNFAEARSLGLEGISRTQEVINKLDDETNPAISRVKMALDGTRDEMRNSFQDLGKGIVEGFQGAVKTLTDPVGAALSGFLNWLMGALSELGSGVVNLISKNVIDPILSALRWVQDQISGWVTSLWEEATRKIRGGSPMEPQEAFSLVPSVVIPLALGTAGGMILLDVLSTKILGIGLDLSGIKEFLNRLAAPELIASTTIGVLLGTGIRDPLTQYFKSTFRTTLPSADEAFRMYYRGVITESELDSILARMGFKDEYIRGFKEIKKLLPGISDMISFIVKEAHMPEKQQEFPQQLAEWLKLQGMEEEWAKLYWGAHWQLPSVTQVYEMLWRGLVSREEVAAFLREADIEPRWREKLIKISYKLPGRIESRWALEWGIWDEQKMAEFLKAEGLDPDFIPDVVKIEKANVFREHINAVKSVLVQKYREGFLNESELASGLRELGYPEEATSLIVRAAKEQRECDMLADAKSLYISAYKSGKIDEGTLMQLLASMGMDPVHAESYVRFLSAAMNAMPISKPTISLEVQALKGRIEQQRLKLLDLQSDLEQKRKELEVARQLWNVRLRKQEEICSSYVDEAKKRKCLMELEELKLRAQLDILAREGRVREIEESIRLEEEKLRELEDELQIKQKSIRAG